MKYIAEALAVFILCAHSIVAHAQAAAERKPCFRIFDASGFKGKPDLSKYGIEPATVIYAGNIFWPGMKHMERLPQRPVVSALNRQFITSRRPVPRLTVIDVEHWPNTGEASVVQATVDKYLTLFDWVKEDVPDSAVGYYAIPPLRDYWRATKGAASQPYKEWQAQNDQFVRLAQALDVFTPSLYTFYDDARGWELYAIANIDETRRLAQGKPIYPFLWPHYHDSSKVKGYVSKDFWRVQLQTLERYADGVVIWAGQEVWDQDAGWWQATREFMANSTRVCKGAQPNSPRLHAPEAK